MARNVEIKARIASVEAVLPVAAALADAEPVTIHQDDTFFPCPNGRLKLRRFADNDGQLIFYQRPDGPGPKESRYSICPTSEPRELRGILGQAFGEQGRVVKTRILLLCGQTRIHLDRVEGLGDFLELEVVLTDEQSVEAGTAIANALLARLGIPDTALLCGAYRDLLAAKGLPVADPDDEKDA